MTQKTVWWGEYDDLFLDQLLQGMWNVKLIDYFLSNPDMSLGKVVSFISNLEDKQCNHSDVNSGVSKQSDNVTSN